MKILVCGSRGWDDGVAIEGRLSEFDAGTLVIHGGADGADSLAGEAARSMGFATQVFTPAWDIQGRRAGFVRNLRMLDEGPELVLAFWDGRSSGTRHTITEARRRGIPVEVVGSGDTPKEAV